MHNLSPSSSSSESSLVCGRSRSTRNKTVGRFLSLRCWNISSLPFMHMRVKMRSPYAGERDPSWRDPSMDLDPRVLARSRCARVRHRARLLFLRPQHSSSSVGCALHSARHFPIAGIHRCMPTDRAQAQIVFQNGLWLMNPACGDATGSDRVQVSQTGIDPGGITSSFFLFIKFAALWEWEIDELGNWI